MPLFHLTVRVSGLISIFLIFASGLVTSSPALGQGSVVEASVLHIQQTQTTSQGSQQGFPTFLAMFQVLDGATSPAEAVALNGMLSLKNYTPTFSEVLWALVYWQGECPAHDINLTPATAIIWRDILKNPLQSETTFPVNLIFPHPLPMTGCLGLYYGGGPLIQGKATMSANLDLAYRPAKTPSPNRVLDLDGEYCFGQDGGCQNATAIDGEAFAVPVKVVSGDCMLVIYGRTGNGATDNETQVIGLMGP